MNNEAVSYMQETDASATTFVNRNASQTRLIAGVSVPDDPLITAVSPIGQRKTIEAKQRPSSRAS